MLGTHIEDIEVPLTSQLNSYTRNGLVYLDILKKPAKYHRPQYETEGSRGVVKDYEGNGHPIVRLSSSMRFELLNEGSVSWSKEQEELFQLNGYNRPAKLQIFIGTGSGDVAPHPFYRACQNKTRNFTDCEVKIIEETVVLEISFIPDMNQMVANCDCIGIVKLRNYDVQENMKNKNCISIGRMKKLERSTNIRIIFRTKIMHEDNSYETIHIASEPIDVSKKRAETYPTSASNFDMSIFKAILDHIEPEGSRKTTQNSGNTEPSSEENPNIELINIDENMTVLDLDHQRIPAISSITSLHMAKSLERLYLRWNRLIKKIDYLVPMVQLKEVALCGNQITVIENLDTLVNLEILDLSINRIKEISGLDNLKNLKKLFLVSNRITKIENVDHLKKLKELELTDNKIRAIENISGLENLDSLFLGNNKISKIENLETLTKLKLLSLPGNRITKIENIDKLFKLELLYLSENKLTHIEGLRNNKLLSTLDLASNKISVIKNVNHLEDLTEFLLNDNNVSDWSCIDNLSYNKKLSTVYLEHNPVFEEPNYRRKIKLAIPWITQIDATHLARSNDEWIGSPGTTFEPLKSDSSSSSSGMKRSSSFPNLSKTPGLTGLMNLGNTCYMNSIVQCLSNTDALRQQICTFSKDGLRGVSGTPSAPPSSVALHLDKVVRKLWAGNHKCFPCDELKTVCGKLKASFRGYEQQDSHEFLTVLLDWLHGDLNVPAPLTELSGASEASGELAWGQFRRKNNSIVINLFYGQLKSTVTCLTCAKESTTFEPFSNLSLPLPPQNLERCTLQDCLELYLKEEGIAGWNCPQCKAPRHATKKFDISRLPPILVIHLKRFTSNGARKKQTLVDFPVTDRLEMLYYATNTREQRNSSYDLYAVSNHYGATESGHYTAYCLNPVLRRWYEFNDTEVLEMQVHNVRTAAAYILFYKAQQQ